MFAIQATDKTFDQASADLESAVAKHGFTVLHIHDLGATLRSKGKDFKEECRVLEVCNAGKAAQVLALDMRLNMALPCRISVYTQSGQTFIGMIRPTDMLSLLSKDSGLLAVGKEVEQQVEQMIQDAL
ncbi:MAG: DUF302 domain-containing protein [Acidobacteria bacterium]|nr:DUF302 domain-containing protein [Acidobacteriota bacterium]